ncbi:MAG: SPOR domain-containing protein [Gemmatimonadota bacterium]|nr:SPOR domain-containing protein [Gemmatimonadota bacterium]
MDEQTEKRLASEFPDARHTFLDEQDEGSASALEEGNGKAQVVALVPATKAGRLQGGLDEALKGLLESKGNLAVIDMDISSPHSELLGAENSEGLTDVLLYGVSPAKVLRTSQRPGLKVITPGTFTPRAVEIYRNQRWKSLIEWLAGETGSPVVLLGPPMEQLSELPVLEYADSVIVFSEPGPEGESTGDIQQVMETVSRSRAPESSLRMVWLPETEKKPDQGLPAGEPEEEPEGGTPAEPEAPAEPAESAAEEAEEEITEEVIEKIEKEAVEETEAPAEPDESAEEEAEEEITEEVIEEIGQEAVEETEAPAEPDESAEEEITEEVIEEIGQEAVEEIEAPDVLEELEQQAEVSADEKIPDIDQPAEIPEIPDDDEELFLPEGTLFLDEDDKKLAEIAKNDEKKLKAMEKLPDLETVDKKDVQEPAPAEPVVDGKPEEPEEPIVLKADDPEQGEQSAESGEEEAAAAGETGEEIPAETLEEAPVDAQTGAEPEDLDSEALFTDEGDLEEEAEVEEEEEEESAAAPLDEAGRAEAMQKIESFEDTINAPEELEMEELDMDLLDADPLGTGEPEESPVEAADEDTAQESEAGPGPPEEQAGEPAPEEVDEEDRKGEEEGIETLEAEDIEMIEEDHLEPVEDSVAETAETEAPAAGEEPSEEEAAPAEEEAGETASAEEAAPAEETAETEIPAAGEEPAEEAAPAEETEAPAAGEEPAEEEAAPAEEEAGEAAEALSDEEIAELENIDLEQEGEATELAELDDEGEPVAAAAGEETEGEIEESLEAIETEETPAAGNGLELNIGDLETEEEIPPPVKKKKKVSERGRNLVLAGLLFLIIAGTGYVWYNDWAGEIRRQGVTEFLGDEFPILAGFLPGSKTSLGDRFQDEEASRAADSLTVETAEVREPEPEMDYPSLNHSIQLGSFRFITQALEARNQLATRGITNVYVAPLQLDSLGDWNRLYMGYFRSPGAADSALGRASSTMGQLKLSGSPIVRQTPYTLCLGEYETLDSLTAECRRMDENNIPYYSIQLRPDSTRTLYRLFVGAFENEDQAALIRTRLFNLGIWAEVQERKAGTKEVVPKPAA